MKQMKHKRDQVTCPNCVYSAVLKPCFLGKKNKTLKMLVSRIYAFNWFIVLPGVSHSGPNSTDISLCYANRSAALFHLGQYEVSIRMPGEIGEDGRGSRGALDLHPCLLLPRNTKIGPCATG